MATIMKPEYFELSQIEEAIVTLYFVNDESKRNSANGLLVLAQSSQSAWNFVWDLLDPGKADVIQFFGAHVLCHKLTYQWLELPQEQHMMLWTKLANCLNKLSNAPRHVITCLCTTLGLFALRTIRQSWPTAVLDIIQSFQNSFGEHSSLYILKTLSSIADKFGSMDFANCEKIALRGELKKNIPQVLNLAQHFISPNISPELAIQAMECASVWIEIGIALPDLHSIIYQLLQISHHSILSEEALQALTKILTLPDSHRYETTVLNLLKDILELEVLLHKALRENDEELASKLFDLFVSVATTHCRLFLDTLTNDNPYIPQILRFYELALMCSNAPGQYPRDERYSEHAFNFWFTLKDDFAGSKPDHMQLQLKYITPVFDKLVDILLRKSMLPNNSLELSASDLESLRTYREDVGDTLAHCYHVLGSTMLSKMDTHLRHYLELTHKDTTHWPQLESCLHAYKFLAEDVDITEEIHIPRLIECLPRVPLVRTEVVCMALDTLGCFSDWLQQHPLHIQQIVPLLVIGLRSPQYAFYGTMALKDLTRDSPEGFRPHALHLLEIGQGVLHSDNLTPKDSARLMYCVGKLLSMFPNHIVISVMEPIVAPYIKKLGVLCVQEANIENSRCLFDCLEMFSQLFSSVVPYSDQENFDETSPQSLTGTDVSPVIYILQIIMPIMKVVVDRWCDSWVVLEEVCRVIKQAVSALFDGIVPIMMDLLGLLVHLYKTHPLPIALKVTEQFLVMFGSDKAHSESMNSLMVVIVEVTLEKVPQQLSEESEMLTSFLGLLTQVLKKHTHLLIQPNINIENLFKFATLSLGALDYKLAKQASHFIVHLIYKSREYPVLLDVVNTHGESLVLQTIKSISDISPKGASELYADVLLALNKKYCDYLARWLHKVLLIDGFPVAHLTNGSKDNFISSILRIKTSKPKLTEVVKDFSLLCRGLTGTQFGKEIMTAI